MAASTLHERLDASVLGRVQGVGFRWFVMREASRLQLTGWVANESDGSVHVVAEGPPDRLDLLEGALGVGPEGATVEHVEARRSSSNGGFHRFELRSRGHRGD